MAPQGHARHSQGASAAADEITIAGLVRKVQGLARAHLPSIRRGHGITKKEATQHSILETEGNAGGILHSKTAHCIRREGPYAFDFADQEPQAVDFVDQVDQQRAAAGRLAPDFLKIVVGLVGHPQSVDRH